MNVWMVFYFVLMLGILFVKNLMKYMMLVVNMIRGFVSILSLGGRLNDLVVFINLIISMVVYRLILFVYVVFKLRDSVLIKLL